MQILDYQRKPNAKRRGNPRRKMGLADQLSQQQVLGPAVGPSGPESRSAPGNGPVPFNPTQGDRTQSGGDKLPYGQQGTQFLGLPGMFLSAGIPDRVGDEQRNRRMRELQIQESGVGRDGGPSIDDTPSRIPNDRAKPFYPTMDNMDPNFQDRRMNRRTRKRYRTD